MPLRWCGTLETLWLLFVGCLTSQQQASVSQGRIYSDIFTCCHAEVKAADQTFYLTQSQYTDTGPTSPRADPVTPGAWQGSHWSAMFKSLVWLDPEKSGRQRDSKPGSSALEADTLTTRPARRSENNLEGIQNQGLYKHVVVGESTLWDKDLESWRITSCSDKVLARTVYNILILNQWLQIITLR